MSTASRVDQPFESITEYLSGDHRRLDGLLGEVEHAVAEESFPRARERHHELEVGLDRHIRLEEELLFPLFEARSGMSGPTVVMAREHRQIRAALRMMGEGLAKDDATAFSEGRRWLEDVLPEHDSKEEHILYPMTDKLLSSRERTLFLARLTSF
jgi:iron-sulfur cluster repair protein YtfE (RIC family)